MALDITKKFEVGNTVYFECVYRGADGSVSDPALPTWTITTTKGVIEATGSPEKRVNGIWYFFWTPINTGDYLLTFAGQIDDSAVLIRKKFKVIQTGFAKVIPSSKSFAVDTSLTYGDLVIVAILTGLEREVLVNFAIDSNIFPHGDESSLAIESSLQYEVKGPISTQTLLEAHV